MAMANFNPTLVPLKLNSFSVVSFSKLYFNPTLVPLKLWWVRNRSFTSANFNPTLVPLKLDLLAEIAVYYEFQSYISTFKTDRYTELRRDNLISILH